MLALSAGTTLVALLGLTGLSGLLDSSDDLEDEAQSDALEVAVVFCRIWLLASAVIGVLSTRGSLQVSPLQNAVTCHARAVNNELTNSLHCPYTITEPPPIPSHIRTPFTHRHGSRRLSSHHLWAHSPLWLRLTRTRSRRLRAPIKR